MPVTLSELSQPKSHKKRHNMTVISDLFNDNRVEFNKALDYPGNEYSSSWTVPAFHDNFPPPPAQRYINDRSIAAGLDRQAQSAIAQSGRNDIMLPRSVPPAEISSQYDIANPMYNSFTTNPEMAGGVPMMKDAQAADHSVPVEAFRYREDNMNGCNDALLHCMTCKSCRKMLGLGCHHRGWFLTILLILIVMCIVGFYMFRRPYYYE